MYRFEKKATLVCAAASLITACCLPLSANVAFAQDSVEAQSIESKADFSSVVSDHTYKCTKIFCRAVCGSLSAVQ